MNKGGPPSTGVAGTPGGCQLTPQCGKQGHKIAGVAFPRLQALQLTIWIVDYVSGMHI
jgi:hypothetical protein